MLRTLRRILLFLTGASLALSWVQLFAIGGFSMSVNKLVTALLLILASLQIVVAPRRMPRNPKHAWVLAYAATVVIGLVMGALAGVPLSSAVVMTTTFAAVILFYFLLAYIIADRGDLDLLLWAFVLGTAFMSVSALLRVGPEWYGESARWGAPAGCHRRPAKDCGRTGRRKRPNGAPR